MNTFQKTILLVAALMVIVAVLFPTWSVRVNGLEMQTMRMFLYSEGKVAVERFVKQNNLKSISKVPSVGPDYYRMTAEIVLICILALCGCFVVKKDRAK